MVDNWVCRFLHVIMLFTFTIVIIPSQAHAANLKDLPLRQNQLLIREIYRMADQGKILSNDEFGIGSTREDIAGTWGMEYEEDPGYYKSKGVGFKFSGDEVTSVYPTDHEFYALTDEEILMTLGDPDEYQNSSDESVKLYRYVTKKRKNHLIFIIRKIDFTVAVDYVLLHKTDDRSEIHDIMEGAMDYGKKYRRMACVIL